MSDSKSTRSAIPLTVLVLYGLVVAATFTLWFVFTPVDRGPIAVTTLAFLLFVQTGYLALFLAGYLSDGLQRALPAATRVIVSLAWTAYALVGCATIALLGGIAAAAGIDPLPKLLALLFGEFVVFALPTGLLFGFGAAIGTSDAAREAVRGASIDSGRSLQRLSGLLRERSPRTELAEADRIARDLEAARATLAHAPLALTERISGSAQPALYELDRLAEQPWPEDPAARATHVASIARLVGDLRRALSPALVA
ncbi:MAG: hypothetical protein EPO68_12405 [Planctomycetota bacterium]|nr:MAG: hypothetical protein EPO68_12405 [Planctomycetota bacterium]